MQNDRKVKLARSILPVVEQCAYLDTGSVGPVSTIYAETLQRCTEEDTRTGRARDFRWHRIGEARERIRIEVAGLLHAEASQLELTQGTTDALRRLVTRFPWQAGDEIVSTRLEYPACGDAISIEARSRGLELKLVDVPDEAGSDLAWLEQAVSAKTRLIALSGVAYTTGQRLPLAEIAAFAQDRGIRTLIDGAQLIGAYPFELASIPVDYLAMPLQKWLCGPEGLGALYVRDRDPTLLRNDRAEQGWPVLEATATHLAWLGENLGWQWMQERTQALGEFALRTLQAFESDRLLTPKSHAGLIALACEKGASAPVAERLAANNLVVRYRPELDLFRISTAFFVTENEIQRYAETIRR